jgi:hypothetical protein
MLPDRPHATPQCGWIHLNLLASRIACTHLLRKTAIHWQQDKNNNSQSTLKQDSG